MNTLKMNQRPVKEKFKDQTPCWPNHTKKHNVVCDTILMRKRKQKFGIVWTNSIVIFLPIFLMGFITYTYKLVWNSHFEGEGGNC